MAVSKVAGGLDWIYSLTPTWLRGGRLFSLGFGDVNGSMRYFCKTLAALSRAGDRPAIAADVADQIRVLQAPIPLSDGWLPWTSSAVSALPAECLFEIAFPSPLADQLPLSSQTARALIVFQRSSLDDPYRADPDISLRHLSSGAKPTDAVVHMPAFGEQDYAGRLGMARQIMRERPNSLHIILMAPFYGERKPPQQSRHYVLRLADMLVLANAISAEAALLVEWSTRMWPRCHAIITGFSFGAAMTSTSACLASALLEGKEDQAPVRVSLGVVPCVGSGTPAVVADGVLHGDIDWTLLRSEFPALQQDQELLELVTTLNDGDEAEANALRDAKTADEFVLNLLRIVDTRKMVKALHKRWAGNDKVAVRFGSVVAVGAEHDSFVKVAYSEQLFHALQSVALPQRASFSIVGGGHVAAFIRRERIFVPAVLRAIRQLDDH